MTDQMTVPEIANLVHTYIAHKANAAELRGAGEFELANRQTALANMDATEMREEYDLDIDELADEVNLKDSAAMLAGRLYARGKTVPEYAAYTMRSVRVTHVVRDMSSGVSGFYEVLNGSPTAVPIARQSMLKLLLESGAVALDQRQELRPTARRTYLRVYVTELGAELFSFIDA